MGQVCEIPRSGPFKPALPYRRYGTGHHGGKLAEIPKPHIRAFDVARRLRVVTVTITRFYGSGPHYYIRELMETEELRLARAQVAALLREGDELVRTALACPTVKAENLFIGGLELRLEEARTFLSCDGSAEGT